ncbi:endonuclease [Arsukibacterium ikkense]|uniref:Endonuclease n=1 Tax=Arsukibacterium ikkense TaxID=336831 RepID=A0A0M2V4Y0_9GAMM|nr:DNA/RNA non-specific endonuclease [Arsukibacterium ikkense]KKO45464.1 endonuclease [Arsukibacterium ikkense]
MKTITQFTFVIITLLYSGIASAANCVYGCPTGKSGQTIERPIYTLHNNSSSKFANWVAYQVTPHTIDGPSRSRTWRADPDINPAHTLEPADYTDAAAVLGTDRGHQVPLAAFSNTPYWAMTNYLSNITPQAANLNQGAWVKLETAVRNLARTGQHVYVVTGPLYEWYFGTLPGADESHTIPSGYFKVVITNNAGWVEASAYIMEQNLARAASFCPREVTINQVEARTGLNIMPTLPAYKEPAVEGQVGGLKKKLGC